MSPGVSVPSIPGFERFERIGGGGFGTVYRAFQPRLNRTVAIKVLHGAAGLDERALRRFEREQQAMGALSSHPGIVTLYDAGATADGIPYLVMEHMAGGSLAERLAQQGSLPVSEAVEITTRVAAAVDHAHRARVLHRDIKPDNILISELGEPKLSDFGIAALVEGTATVTTTVTATVEHAAPEVLDGDKPTAAADIYSLASTCYTLISGHSPHRHSPDDSMLAILGRVATQPPIDLRTEHIPAPVCDVLEQGLARDPVDRPPTAGEFVHLLQEAVGQTGGTAAVVPTLIPGVAVTPGLGRGDSRATRALDRPERQPEPEPQPEATSRRSRKRLALALAAGLLVIGGAGGAAALLLTGGDPDDAGPSQVVAVSTSSQAMTTAATGTHTSQASFGTSAAMGTTTTLTGSTTAAEPTSSAATSGTATTAGISTSTGIPGTTTPPATTYGTTASTQATTTTSLATATCTTQASTTTTRPVTTTTTHATTTTAPATTTTQVTTTTSTSTTTTTSGCIDSIPNGVAVSVSPKCGEANTLFEIAVSGVKPGARWTLVLGNPETLLADQVAECSGTGVASWRKPASWPTGYYWVQVKEYNPDGSVAYNNMSGLTVLCDGCEPGDFCY
jgi:serine/threonine protein kinase